jgi:hypothetical protein
MQVRDSWVWESGVSSGRTLDKMHVQDVGLSKDQIHECMAHTCASDVIGYYR